MKFKSHGKGFLVFPEKHHQDYGTKYYHNGWWMSKYNAWFFKKEYEKYILENIIVNKNKTKINPSIPVNTSNIKEVDGDSKDNIFKNMVAQKYGKGYLLIPEDNHKDYGIKYYNNGWWIKKHKAWFFKKEYKKYLLNSGIQNIKNENNTFGSNVTLKEYGKGYLLIPEKNHPDWGIKYYNNGWWIPKHNAWFFKKTEPFITSNQKEQGIFESFKLQKYGKGYMLSVDKDHVDWGKKYYYNGWWFKNHESWFFKEEWKQYLIDNGAQFI